MATNTVDKLKKQLRDLGFDNRIDAELETTIKGGLSQFYITYKDEQKEKGLSYHIHFSKNDRTGAYQITQFVTFLEREITISHAFINGISTSALENKLSGFDWSTYYGGRENHEVVESFRNDLTILSQTEQGRKIGQLLIAKYWPADMPVSERDRFLTFDAFTNNFCLRKIAPADGSWSAHLVYDLLKGGMDDLSQLKNIHNYALTIEAETVKSHAAVIGRSNIVFESLPVAFANLEAIDFRLFDKDFVTENKLPCQIKKINLVDTFDNVVIASKIIGFKRSTPPQESPFSISYEINDKKIQPLDFVSEVKLDINKSINRQSIDDIKYILNTYHLSAHQSHLNKAPDLKVKPSLKTGRRFPGR